jgi:hypothetical protein
LLASAITEGIAQIDSIYSRAILPLHLAQELPGSTDAVNKEVRKNDVDAG